MVIEADRNFLLGNGVIIDEITAAPNRENFVDYLQRLPEIVDLRKGTKVAGAVVDYFSRQKHLRKRLAGDANVWIRFIIPHEDVVARFMLLDHGRFCQQRF